MANIYTGTINTHNEYLKLASLADVTFTADTTYAIQVQNVTWLREGTEGKGFLFNKDKGYTWKCTGDDLYIRTTEAGAIVNIAENSGFFLNKSGSGGGGGAKSKYGITMDSILGNVNAEGELEAPSTDGNLVFTGVEKIAADNLLRYRFYENPAIKSVSFPDLTTVSGKWAMQYCFSNCSGITNVDLSALTTVNGESAMQYCFYNCSGITNVDLSALTTVSGQGTMYNCFCNCKGITSIDLSALTTVNSSTAMKSCFQNCAALTKVDLSALTTINSSDAMYGCFQNCAALTKVDLPALTTVNGQEAMQECFRDCKGLTGVNLPSLTTVNGTKAMFYCFVNCPNLTDISFPELAIIGENSFSFNNTAHFSSCFNSSSSKITTLTFPKLKEIYCTGSASASNGTFYNNNKIEKMYFPMLDTITYGAGATTANQGACNYIFANCNALTEIHFSAANQAAIEATTGYPTLWGRGAGNATVYFDL